MIFVLFVHCRLYFSVCDIVTVAFRYFSLYDRVTTIKSLFRTLTDFVLRSDDLLHYTDAKMDCMLLFTIVPHFGMYMCV